MATDTSQYYTDPTTGITYTSYDAYKQNIHGATPNPPPATPTPTPTPSTTSTGLSSNPTTARGDQSYVMFSNDPHTIFLYDGVRKFIVPFPTEQSLFAFSGMTPDQLMSSGHIQKLNFAIGSPEQKSWGVIVPDAAGFGDNGQVKDFSYYQNIGDATGLDGRYGKTRNVDLENTAAQYLSTSLKTLVDQGAISQSTLNQYMNDPIRVASYINAWVYGGYNMDDIFRDIKAKELGLTNVKTIDPTQSATDFQKTPDYALAKNNQQLSPPINLKIDPAFFNNPIFSIPDAAFKTLVPVVDINSPDFKDKASKIQEAYYDVLLQQLDATTSQAKSIADDNYNLLKDQVQKQYGIQLADNASAAWTQVQQLGNNASANGQANSGMFNEAQDRLLADRRKSDQRLRDTNATDAETKKRDYYLNSATPQQIKNDLTPEERQKWGLTPTQATLDFINNIKTTYPNLTDAQVQQYKNSFVDENGNLRSQLYQNLFINKFGGVSSTGAPVTGVQQNKELQQQQDELAKSNKAITDAYAPYTKSDNPFIGYQGAITPPPTTPVPTNPYPASGTTPSPIPSTTPTAPSATPTTPSGYYTDPSTGITYTSYDAYKQNIHGATPNPNPPPTPTPTTPKPVTQPIPRSATPTTPSKYSFSSFVQTPGSKTVYGVDAKGQNVGFENEDQFLQSGGQWGNVKQVKSVSNPINYSSYKPIATGSTDLKYGSMA